MDKNKSRTDLLAAGRIKLQQFRQKKDNKGSSSHGKSSQKSSKSEKQESDADAASKTRKSAAMPQVVEAEIEPQSDSSAGREDSSVSSCVENSVASDVDTMFADPPSVVMATETGITEAALFHESGTDAQEDRVRKNDILDSDGESKQQDTNLPAPSTSVDATDAMTVTVDTQSKNEEEMKQSLPSQEDTPDASSIPARGDQVTDVGAMQEADGLGSNQFGGSSDVEQLEGDRRLSSSGQGEIAENAGTIASEQVHMEEATSQLKQSEVADDASVPESIPDLSEQSVASTLAVSEVDGNSGVIHEATNQPREVVDIGPQSTENVSGHDGNSREGVPSDSLIAETSDPQYFPDDSFVFVNGTDERPPLAKSASTSDGYAMSPLGDACPISFAQIIEVIKELSEDEHGLLLKSKGSVSNAESENVSSFSPRNGFPGLLEKLREELFLTNCTKDILQMQLHENSDMQIETERHLRQLDDEISMLHASLVGAHEKSSSLAEELAECRSELQASVRGREELEQQVVEAKAEIHLVSTREYELQISLESSQSDLLRLSKELAESRDFVAALQGEIENLNDTIASVSEETKKVGEEKISLLHEKEKLSDKLADCKNLVAALQVESSNLNGTVASMTKEKMNLEGEKEYLSNSHEKTCMELSDCKGLVEALQTENVKLSECLALATEERKKFEEKRESLMAALQAENSNLNGIVASMTEKKMNLEGEKEYLASSHEKICMELSDCKCLVETLQAENVKLSESLAVATEEREKFEEELKFSVREREQLSSEFLVLNDKLSKDHAECMRYESELKEVTMQLEQLTEENIFLTSNLDVLKAKLREIDETQAQSSAPACQAANPVGSLGVQSRDSENATDEGRHCQATFSMSEKSMSGEVFPDSSGFPVLKGHLKEAEKILQGLEKAIEGMHSHSVLLSRAGGKAAVPAVSRLIQAFESKVHRDENEVEDSSMTEDQSLAADTFAITKENTGNLKAVLKQLALAAQNASLMFQSERDDRSAANFAITKLKFQCGAMKEHSDNLEANNVELLVLYEAVKQHLSAIKERNGELEVLYESLRQQEFNLKAENYELGKKLSEHELKIEDLEGQLRYLQKSSDEKASALHEELANYRMEAAEGAFTVEQEWNSTVARIIEAVDWLDDSAGFLPTSATSTPSDGSFDVSSRVAASVNAAITMIKDLKENLEVASTDHETASNLFKQVNEKCNEMLGKNEMANATLQKLYSELRGLVTDSCGSAEESDRQDEELPDPLDYSRFKALVEKLENALAERLQFQSANDKLNSELMARIKDVDELSRMCLDLSSIQRLTEDVEGVVKLEDGGTDSGTGPISRLESLVSSLVHRYKEADEQLNSSKEEFGSKVMELAGLQKEVNELTGLKLQHEDGIHLLKEHLTQSEDALVAVRSELQDKVSELQQSEQKVTSIREKLGIAVAKGKGLVVQRDGLKQSLAETSSELERCSQELQLKDARLLEVEAKLKTYSEAGERAEALESELSYIRNSATALRESFLLKDSVLQRIEESLEDLDLPEHFHSRDIIEKVDWLARSATGNSLPPADWDQKSSVGGSHSDAGFVVMDAWKEDVQASSNLGDDLRREYEELQTKFYGLAEQNEMLEQSLMERNNLVQRWEEHLDRISLPSHLRSAEPEDRIEWLGSALSEAIHHRNSLLQKIDELENYCGSLTADMGESEKRVSHLIVQLEESQKRISDLERDLEEVVLERENLRERLEILNSDLEKLSAKAIHFEMEHEKLQNEASALQEKLADKLLIEEHIQSINSEICRLQDLVCDALQDPGAKDFISGGSSTECLEILLRKLVDNYTTLSSAKPEFAEACEELHAKKSDTNVTEGQSRDILDFEESAVSLLKRDVVADEKLNDDALKKELEETLSELACVKEERDRYREQQQSLVCEVEGMEKKRVDLQDLLLQEEQKSASAREKLNVAVRKGKSLIQQRDSLKQTIDELNAELMHLKAEIKNRENALIDYEQKIKDLTIYSERVEALESESSILRNHLAETEHLLQEKEHTLTMILSALEHIDFDGETCSNDPIEKLDCMGKLCRNLRAAVASAEQESRKSGRAAELLLAELNEVQDRNDSLQEELAKATMELSEISKERDMAEAAKLEALSRLERSFTVYSEEKKKHFSELAVLKSAGSQLRQSFSDINNLLTNVFTMELEFLQNVEACVSSCLDRTEANLVVHVPHFSTADAVTSSNSENMLNFHFQEFSSESRMPDNFDDSFIIDVRHSMQELMKEIGDVKVMLQEHSSALHGQAGNVSKLIGLLHREMLSRKESLEAMARDMKHIQSIEKEKDREIVGLHQKITLLYEACTSSLMEIENRRAKVSGITAAAGSKAIKHDDGFSFGGGHDFPSEEHFKDMAERLLLAVKDFASSKGAINEGDKKEMKVTISNLQKELQEKDIQRERICMELVHQIEEAEAAAAAYSLDLQSSRTREDDLKKQVNLMLEERKSSEQRVKELEDGQALLADLQKKVRSRTDVVAAKEQEIEALMQALDEEEVQMEELNNKTKELEKILQQKNLDIENLEASRGKALKKLSMTLNKFDELHHFSESLLAEVEKLQSQLQERDAEISFLRQEVTRCTNEVLATSQMSSKKNSDGIHELLMWLDPLVSQVGMQDVNLDDSIEGHEPKVLLQKKITNVMSKVEDLRVMAESRDTLVQMERNKVDELTRRVGALESSLREKESQLNMLEGVEDLGQSTSTVSEIVEVEPLINKWVAPGPSSSSQVRNLRKLNSDQVAIAIDEDPSGDSTLEDEDDDKVHGFKSLTSSRIVPKFTRPVSDVIDGLWVSCDRALMRRPALRLCIIFYWAIIHTLLATFAV